MFGAGSDFRVHNAATIHELPAMRRELHIDAGP